MANLKSRATSLDSINLDEDIKVRVYENAAVTTSRVTIKGQYSGKKASGRYSSILVWVKGAAGWQLVANQLTPIAAE
ncbi:MAG: nuclear transport factor 2 family protein [Gemmatimonadaceae bacterium]|nr:nuclear transport factor 2 family protein [Gemmatimonadaceae bacterium]